MSGFLLRLGGCALVTWLVYLFGHRLAAGMGGVHPAIVNVVVFSLAAVLWGSAFAVYLIGIIPAIRDKARRDVCEPMNGRFYAYDNHRLRLYLIDDVIWIPERDLMAVLRPVPDARELRLLGEDYATLPGQKLRAFTERAVLRMMALRTAGRFSTHDMIRFKHWLEKEAIPNLRRFPVSSAE
ncbi:MAG: hypothetical protein V4723_02270 [Pseudomonadota bacterium]